jgi:hypothetical protein
VPRCRASSASGTTVAPMTTACTSARIHVAPVYASGAMNTKLGMKWFVPPQKFASPRTDVTHGLKFANSQMLWTWQP